MQNTRRNFLLTTSALALSGGVAAASGHHQPVQDPSEDLPFRAIGRKRIPSSGELLPMVGLGTSRTFDVDPAQDAPQQLEVLRRFLDLGGSLIDSSPMYGHAEALSGKLCKELGRSDLFYATKVWTDKGREAGIAQMEESRRRMGPERFDLMQVHNLVGLKDHLPVLKEWKRAGKIRYLGVTEMRDYATVERLIRDDEVDFIQIPYSLGNRVVEERVLPAALDHGVAVLVMRPFEAGRLFKRFGSQPLPPWAVDFDCQSWGQFFLKFVLGHPAVTCPIPATAKPHHLVDNMGAGVGRLPDASQRKQMLSVLES